MKKKYRVKKADEFQTIIEHRKFVSCPSLVLYVKARKEDQSRIGISVGKKLGNAVVRNKTKRQVRMMFQEIYDFNENFDSCFCCWSSSRCYFLPADVRLR